MKENKDKRKIGLGIILRVPLFVVLQIIILFGAAGRIDIPRAWIYFVIVFVYYSIGLVIMYKFNPEPYDSDVKATGRTFGVVYSGVLV